MESYYGLNSVTVCPADLTQVLFKTWSCDSAISPLCEELFWCASKRAKVLAGPFFFFFLEETSVLFTWVFRNYLLTCDIDTAVCEVVHAALGRQPAGAMQGTMHGIWGLETYNI